MYPFIVHRYSVVMAHTLFWRLASTLLTPAVGEGPDPILESPAKLFLIS